MPHKTKDKRNINQCFSLKGLNKNNIIQPPTPYIGSQGPNIVPLFTKTPSLTKWNITSQTHPINENEKKNNIYVVRE